MIPLISQFGLRLRILLSKLLERLGFGEHAILLPLAILIGVLSSVAAVVFHEAIDLVRHGLYEDLARPDQPYGSWLILIVVFPTAGGLLVGLLSQYIIRGREGHGVVDVIETVLRSRGRINPLVAMEKILTSAITIGSGGSAGAEGPIVQIGAGISSGVGQFLQIGRAHLPVLIGCGTAAGISAIFGSPIGGVLFTLEIILLDFSIRSFTPIVLASVIAHVTTRGAFSYLHEGLQHAAIFRMPAGLKELAPLSWSGVPAIAILGLACGLIGVTLTAAMHRSEELFRRARIPAAVRPAAGGAMLGLLGVLYVTVFGWLLLDQAKPIDFHAYPAPAFYGDGYGVIQHLIGDELRGRVPDTELVILLSFIILAKIVGTCLTLSSGGSGGVIAPSLFLGAATGSVLGLLLERVGWVDAASFPPGYFALIGMGAVLAAVVHAPLASILILMEVTGQGDVVLPAMLACVVATGAARLVMRDSIYTLGLRRRGVVVGSGTDVALLRRLLVDQVPFEPVRTVDISSPLVDLLEAVSDNERDFIAVDKHGIYAGMAFAEDVRTALLQRDATAHLLVEDLVRTDVPTLKTTDDLAVAFDMFSRHDVARLPVCLPSNLGRVIGLVSRRELMRLYHDQMLGD